MYLVATVMKGVFYAEPTQLNLGRLLYICSFNRVCKCWFKLFFHFFLYVCIPCCWGM